jgi:nucleoside recognition membrane protein YjiH
MTNFMKRNAWKLLYPFIIGLFVYLNLILFNNDNSNYHYHLQSLVAILAGTFVSYLIEKFLRINNIVK